MLRAAGELPESGVGLTNHVFQALQNESPGDQRFWGRFVGVKVYQHPPTGGQWLTFKFFLVSFYY